MAYASLDGVTFTSKKDMFIALRDFIVKAGAYSTTGIGWTLHDESYAVDAANPTTNDYFVVYSAGENGDEDMYHKFIWINNNFTCYLYLYWNATTHAGVLQAGGSSLTHTEASSDLELDVHGDLTSFFAMLTSDGATSSYAAYFGKVDTVYDSTVATSAGALSSGSDISITVDAVPDSWVVGGNIFIRDTAYIKKITIKTLVGSVITADLTVSFLAGCKLSQDVGYVGPGGNQYATSMKALVEHAGLTAAANVTASWPTIGSYADPEDLDGEWLTFDLLLASANTVYGVMRFSRFMNLTGLTHRDIFVDSDSVTWRWFKAYSNKYIAVKVV